LTIGVIAAAIGIPARQWPGRCHEIATAMCEKGVIAGALQGHDISPPAASADTKFFNLAVGGACCKFLTELVGGARLNKAQGFWLANLPPQRLGNHAKEIYEAFEKADRKAWIPCDNWHYVFKTY